MVDTHSRTPWCFSQAISASRRSGLWLRPPPPGRSSAHSLFGLAHQILLGSLTATSLVYPLQAAAPGFSPPAPGILAIHVRRAGGDDE